MKGNRGFSLLELLIVVAIILIIATIAIPSLLRSRQAANEAAAVANLRALNSAQVNYSSGYGVYGTVSQLLSAGLIDSRFGTSTPIAGYGFSISVSGDQLDYTAEATASSVNTGRYDYYSAPDAVIRYSIATSRAPVSAAGLPVR